MNDRKLFDADLPDNIQKEGGPVNRLKSLEEKMASVIEKVKSLKDENQLLTKRIKELENIITQKDNEIIDLTSERDSIRDQVEELLSELETLEF